MSATSWSRLSSIAKTIERLTDNGPCYFAGDTRNFAREICLEPLNTPVESPQSNGMVEAFVRTFERGYVRANACPDGLTVIEALPKRFFHYNILHPHRALEYRSPR